MLALAQKYAELHGTTVIAQRMVGEDIVFVLESGQKLTMSRSQLEAAVGKPAEVVEEVRKAKKAKKGASDGTSESG